MSAREAGALRGTGGWTRLRIGAQVLFTIAVAAAATLLVTWLADRPGLRWRADLTAAGENTLDENTRGVLERLPEPVAVDVFFRRVDYPLTGVAGEAQARMFDLLVLAEEEAPGKVSLRNHSLDVAPTGGTEVEARMRELGVRDLNVVVVSAGERRAVLHLIGDIAEIDIGVPARPGQPYVPPSLVAFRGEEALVEALLRVSQREKPLALFSWGHGELDLYGEGEQDLGALQAALVGDGFRVERWDAAESGPLPDDCAVLAIVGPRAPFGEQERGWIDGYLARGGRVVAAPGLDWEEPADGLLELLRDYGIRTGRAIVCRPYIDAGGALRSGQPQCAGMAITPDFMARRHPVTEPLVRGGRRVRVSFARPFAHGAAPAGGVLLDLLSTPEITWGDVPDADGALDFEAGPGEEHGPFSIAMVSRFPPAGMARAAPVGTVAERPEARVLALGSATFFGNALFDTNRDLLLNVFNWAASREFRVSVSTRDPEQRRLDVGGDKSLFAVHSVASLGLPGLCLALGLATALRRRRYRSTVPRREAR